MSVTKHFSIGFVNSIGNGFGGIKSLDHINRYTALMSDGKLKVDCKDIKTMEKYFKVLMNTDYFINYQSKIADDYVGDSPIEGIRKRHSTTKSPKTFRTGVVMLLQQRGMVAKA